MMVAALLVSLVVTPLGVIYIARKTPTWRGRLSVLLLAGPVLLLLTHSAAAEVPPAWDLLVTEYAERTTTTPAPVLEAGSAWDAEVRLAVVGDVGTGDASEYRTAAAIHEAAGDRGYDALVLLGDNVYPHGDPERLSATVYGPFGPTLVDGARLLPVLGNHDVENGHGEAQVAALGMPGRWYSVRMDDVLIVVLDSTQPDDPGQLRWLEATLAAEQDAAWKIVVMHHPPFSAGTHGSDLPTRTNFVPIFERHGVDLVLSGHEHDYQRSAPLNGVTYVVSGGGAKVRPTGSADFTEVSFAIRHFVDLQVWPDRISITAISQTGEHLDMAVLEHTPQS